MSERKKPEFDGFGISLSPEGPVFYYFDTNKIDMEELIRIETKAFIHARKKRHHIFKVYETEEAGYIVLSLN